jgi:hypothetical protein
MLNGYRNKMKEQFPEPTKLKKEDPVAPKGKSGMKTPMKSQKSSKAATPMSNAKKGGKASGMINNESPTPIDKDMISNSDKSVMSDESIIMSDDEENFTTNVQNMKGAEYPPTVQEYISSTLLPAPNNGVQLSNLAATRTAFSTKNHFKDFEFKKENLLEIMTKA